MNSSNKIFLHNFSHIYIEKGAEQYELTEIILNKFKNSKRIHIRHYKDVFCRSGQDFAIQKKSINLILAIKKEPFIYNGPDICHNFGINAFYYTSFALNCIYNCDYCFLQGMYTSAAIVIFVNLNEYFNAIDKKLKEGPMFLTISYDTDLLALEEIAPLTFPWIEYARQNKDIIIEIRTKSLGFKKISSIPPVENIRIAFTLSPEEIILKFEKGTPSLSKRLKQIKKAIELGWKIRLCFDPLILVENFEKVYENFLKTVFEKVSSQSIEDVSVGVFRIPSNFLKNIRKIRKDSKIICYPYQTVNGISSYPVKIQDYMKNTFVKLLKNYIKEEKIFL